MTYSEIKYGKATMVGDALRDALMRDDAATWRMVHDALDVLQKEHLAELTAAALNIAQKKGVRPGPWHVDAYGPYVSKTKDPRGQNDARPIAQRVDILRQNPHF